MQFADGWKDGVLATIGTMALQLQEAHQVINEMNEKFQELSKELAELKKPDMTMPMPLFPDKLPPQDPDPAYDDE